MVTDLYLDELTKVFPKKRYHCQTARLNTFLIALDVLVFLLPYKFKLFALFLLYILLIYPCRYITGLIDTKWDLSNCRFVNAESFCRRRLPVMMVRCKMINSIKVATKFIEQGHVRVGPELVKDPAFLVTRFLISSFIL